MAGNEAQRSPAPLRPMGAHRRTLAAQLAADHGGVVHRNELARYGVGRNAIRDEIGAGRWFRAGRHTVAIDAPVLGTEALRWWAVWESGAGARLDGVSALLSDGMTGFTAAAIDVTLPARNRHHALAGVRLHRVDCPPPMRGAGIPRVAVELATIHGAQWAVSDRQAALVICLPIQQRLLLPARLQLAWRGVGRSARRQFINAVIADVADGAHSLGELDFTRMARIYGLPTPSHQVVRSGPRGRVYLDISWDEVGLVVEIDGGHHALALNPVDDALRQNDRVVVGERVLRIPVIGFRIVPEKFMQQVRRTYDVLGRA
ncbi:hypothetical protein [Flexivirga alba]|uniref:DUF559 domain-containing protein n=1 Tax=Flexivirga alba TaxID=702742 RepID=A0ABW2AKX2_9MICO